MKEYEYTITVITEGMGIEAEDNSDAIIKVKDSYFEETGIDLEESEIEVREVKKK